MNRTPALLVLVVLLAACSPHVAAAQPPRGKELAKKVEALIDQLAEVAEPGMGYSGSVSGTMFLPLDVRGHIGTMLLGQRPVQRSEILRELVKLGPDVVPFLIEHLGDKRPTRIPPLIHDGFFGGMFFVDGCDYNERAQKPPKEEGKEEKGLGLGGGNSDRFHRLAVGDLCFVALGQIVNRGFDAVRYQPTAIVFVTSPTRSERLRAAVKEHWGGLTPEKHKASLLADFNKPDHEYRRTGAAKRLAYYYPDALEEHALKFLAQPTFDSGDVHDFVREKLYKAKTAEERKKLLDSYLAGKAAPYRDGVMAQLFGDLNTLEAHEEGRITPPLTEYAGQPRTCLIELFGKPKGVKSKDAPSVIDLLTTADMARFISDALVFDRSVKLDKAVRDLLASIKDDDYLALACMERLIGRGYDADIETYCKSRPAKKNIQAMVAKLGWTPVHVAVSRGNRDDIAALLRDGASAGTAARNGDTPLHLAVAAEDEPAVKLLLDAKATPDAKNKDGLTPLQVAAREESWGLVQLLVDRGAIPQDVLVAAATGKADLVKKFVTDDPACVRSKTESWWTALHLAADWGHKDVAETLLACKAEIDATDKHGLTPLHLASHGGHEAIVRLLISRKADIRIRYRNNGPEALHFAASAGQLKVVELLLDSGAEVKAKGGDDQTALHYAASRGQTEIIELLLKRGAAIDEPDRNKSTPLHAAAEAGQTKAAAILLDRKASVAAQSDGRLTPLHLAVRGGHRDMVALLLRYNADPKAEGGFHGTPLEIAGATGEAGILKLLREAAAKK